MPYKDPEVRRAKQREYQRRYLDKPGGRDAQSRRVAVRKKEIREWIASLRDQARCSHCGEDRPEALDFHHLDGNQKAFAIGEAVALGCSRARILAEIAQCIVLCANCHRVETRRSASVATCGS